MAAVYHAIGAFVIIVGAVIVWFAFAQPIDGPALRAITMARIGSALPGLGIMLSGLLIVSVGGILARLDAIERNTRD